jgi:hypothetical protein
MDAMMAPNWTEIDDYTLLEAWKYGLGCKFLRKGKVNPTD